MARSWSVKTGVVHVQKSRTAGRRNVADVTAIGAERGSRRILNDQSGRWNAALCPKTSIPQEHIRGAVRGFGLKRDEPGIRANRRVAIQPCEQRAVCRRRSLLDR